MDITVGGYYELQDGQVAYVVGASDREERVTYYLDDGSGTRTAPYAEVTSWKRRRDLQDFPNARNPRLPYVFDLLWDLKRHSDLKHALETGHEDIDDIRAAMAANDISL